AFAPTPMTTMMIEPHGRQSVPKPEDGEEFGNCIPDIDLFARRRGDRMTAKMKRREFITLLGGAAVVWPLAVRAQQAGKVLRVGLVSGQPRSAPNILAFEQRLAEIGYQEGKNFIFDFVQAASLEAFEAGYRELAAHKVDIIVAPGNEIALNPALAASDVLPMLMIAID